MGSQRFRHDWLSLSLETLHVMSLLCTPLPNWSPGKDEERRACSQTLPESFVDSVSLVSRPDSPIVSFFFLIFIFTLFYFTILYWFCHTLAWICQGCTWVLSQLFHSPLSLSSRGSLVSLHFLPLECSHHLLRLLIFFPAILISACASSSPEFLIMYFA